MSIIKVLQRLSEKYDLSTDAAWLVRRLWFECWDWLQGMKRSKGGRDGFQHVSDIINTLNSGIFMEDYGDVSRKL